jgi:hypothetical protein
MVFLASAVSEVQLRWLGLRRMLRESGEGLPAQGLALGRGQSRGIEAMVVVQPRGSLQVSAARLRRGDRGSGPPEEVWNFPSRGIETLGA